MTMKLAFAGVGETARPYLDALARRSDVAIVAVSDPDRRAAEQIAAGWNARVVSPQETLLDEAPDALFVCLPPRLQGELILNASERAIPMLIEPPGTVNFALARQCCAQIVQKQVVTAVGFAGRYSDVVAEAREYLGANAIPLALGWWLAPSRAESAFTTAADLLWFDACRLVDGMRYFCGNVTRVRALAAGAGAAAGGLVVQLEFDSGTIGMLTCASFARPAPRIELEMLGEGWSLQLGKDLTQLQLDEHDKSTILRCLNQPKADLAAAFLQAVQTQTPAAVSPSCADALQSLAACEAARISIAEGRPVALTEVL